MSDLLIELFKGKGVQPWFLRLVAANGQTIAISEGYYSKWNAKRAARKVLPGFELKEV